MRNKVGNLLWGLFFIFLGIGMAGRFLWGWDFTLFFDGWWTLFIIIPCVISIIETGPRIPNVFGVLIGALLFLSCQDGLGYIFTWKLVWPLILVAIGLSIIISPFTGGRRYKQNFYDGKCSSYDFQKKMSVSFSERRFSSTTEFDGCELVCSFGSMTVDLKNARVNSDCTINCHNSFGSIVIIVPDNVNIQVYIDPVLGSVNNRVTHHSVPSENTILIQGDCSFGQIVIK